MPSLEWNKATWTRDYDWSGAGEEWSGAFGSSEMQWFGSLLARVHRFVPTPCIVEIAPGFGRWTRFLHPLCTKLVVVDLSETCLAACRERFTGVPHIEYVLNDGMSLAAIPDGSVDFLFSYDSLVHVELDVLGAYVAQLNAKLSPDGVAFIHHSNALAAAADGCPPEYYLDQGHHRGVTVSADAVLDAARRNGLHCPTQELLPLGLPGDPSARSFYLDCITTFVRANGAGDRPPVRIANAGYPTEAAAMRAIAPLYAAR